MEPYTIILALIVVVLTYYFSIRGLDLFKKHKIPHMTPLPLFGNSWRPLLRRVSFAHWIKESYDTHSEAKYVGMFDLMTPIIVIRDPEIIKNICMKNFDHFVDHRSFVDEISDPLFGKNLFSLRGERWKEMRTTLSPAFTSSKMKGMFKLMTECAVYFSNSLLVAVEKEENTDMKDAFTRYTNDVIATCAFGIKIDSMHDRENKFYVYGREATVFGTWTSIKFFLIRSMPTLMRLLGVKVISSEITNFFKHLVAATIKNREENGIVRPDMLQLMMESKAKMGPEKELSIEDMTAQAFIFFFGGFESTATTMCFAAHEIGVNPDVQEKLQAEIDSVLEECNGDVTYEQINDMKYMDAVINETLRLYPIAVSTDRVCQKDYELPPALPGLKPFKIKPPLAVLIPIYGMQHDPKYFDDPETFNPDRFYLDPKKYVNSAFYVPFGIGPRMCIGNRFALLEIKALLFHVLARCNLKPCSKTPTPLELSTRGFAMRPEGGFWLNVEKRKNAHPSVVTTTTNGTTGH